MWRLDKIVLGRLAKALHIDRKPFQHFALRQKALEHFAFHRALRQREFEGHGHAAFAAQKV